MEVLLLFFIYWIQSWDYEYSMHTLNILSMNVNGLNSAVKRTRVLEYLHRKSISCALIQETHLKQSDVARFQNKYYKLAAFSCALNKTKGVLILVNRKLNLTIEHLGSDDVRVLLCVSSVPASCVHIWFVSCPCFMLLWVKYVPAVFVSLCVNYPVYLSPVFWVWFRLVYLWLPGVSVLPCPALSCLVLPCPALSCLVLPWCLH